MTISECEKKINYLSDLSPSSQDDVRSMKAELFFRKATLLHESNFLTDALKYYKIALEQDRNLSHLIDKRIDSLVQSILEKSTAYQNEDELLLALESLKVVSSLDKDLFYKLSPTVLIIEQKIDQIENQSRSFWTGSAGWFDVHSGDGSWNILIRTIQAERKNNQWFGKVGSGGGITTQVDPGTYDLFLMKRVDGEAVSYTHLTLPTKRIV